MAEAEKTEEEKKPKCEPKHILRCTDPSMQARRKRFNVCRDNILCCLECPHWQDCRFVCMEAEVKAQHDDEEKEEEDERLA